MGRAGYDMTVAQIDYTHTKPDVLEPPSDRTEASTQAEPALESPPGTIKMWIHWKGPKGKDETKDNKQKTPSPPKGA
ncbi:hypothetical protein BS50DRAFT_638658 [Corynespora cassiicola Philippines]|uniref:Uncharacterized protein n=1 Tax=Corynespora cassiicola Philippines TaxID=1448308 RepID=A0A2T2NAK1_CORCC|nr:hypothetical protein BS50DRAFT_638658 [Corynespora cassiicola Philippines]